MSKVIPIATITWVPELYPRLKPSDEVIERYRTAIDNLPPITVAKGHILVDGYHRWQAHAREGSTEITIEDLGDLSDAEIIRESIRRNATHGHQLSRADKQKLAGKLWCSFAAMAPGDRTREIVDLLAVSERCVQDWTKNARKTEKDEQKAKVWDLWLDCASYREIGDATGVDHTVVGDWVLEKRKFADFQQAPESRQHFDVWQFHAADKDAGQQSYFGAIPPQVVENLLWFFTEPGHIIVDPFAGSGTAIEVAKRMGRRVWASDRLGNQYAPYLPIHKHNIADDGWPDDAPHTADIVLLDPPYWAQAKGKYSDDADDMGNCSLDVFNEAWTRTIQACATHTERIAYIISPTQLPSEHMSGAVIDHATDMLAPFRDLGWTVERRVIVLYQTQQATGQQVESARANKKMLKLYRDLVVMHK